MLLLLLLLSAEFMLEGGGSISVVVGWMEACVVGLVVACVALVAWVGCVAWVCVTFGWVALVVALVVVVS
jgi:hypothetical protein